jgi:hypothetical protein
MSQKKYLKWNEVSFWKTTNDIWSDVSILIEVDFIIKRAGGHSVYGHPKERLKKDLGDEKTKRIIKLYCKYKGFVYNESREIDENIKVIGSDFSLFIEHSIRERITINVKVLKNKN